MNILIVGAGRVGLANAWYLRELDEGHVISVVDKDKDKIKRLQLKEYIYGPDCVPDLYNFEGNHIRFFNSPQEITDSPDYVIFCIEPGTNANELHEGRPFPLETEINNYWINFSPKAIVLRGTLTHYHIQHMKTFTTLPIDRMVAYPEFLVEGHEQNGVTGNDFFGSFTENEDLAGEISNLYGSYSSDFCTAEEAFAAKLWINAALAMRVTLANMIMDSTKELCDYKRVLKLVGRDNRIGSHYLNPSAGYGGSCLPWAIQQINYLNPIKSIQEYNFERDIELAKSCGDSVLVFGYNFKGPDIEDTRNSCPLRFIQTLEWTKRTIYVHDNIYNPEVQNWWVGSPATVLDKVSDIVIFYQTRWLTRFEENATPIELEKFNSKIKYDFR